MQFAKYGATIVVLIGFLTSPVLAHPHHSLPESIATKAGFSAGFFHPITGLDHMLARVAVGILSVKMGGRFIWIGPLNFLTGMTAGGLSGLFITKSFGTESLIAGTLVLLGLSLMSRNRPRSTLVLSALCLFGAVHGYTHGLEALQMSDPNQYFLGFLISSILLHVAGVTLGVVLNDRRTRFGATPVQISGALISAAGLMFVFGL